MNTRLAAWIANAGVVVVIVVCTRLGFWQLSRFEERSAIAEAREHAHELPPVTDLTTIEGPVDYRRVSLQGRYTGGHMVSGGVKARLNGYAALGVFQVDDGPRVLVLRGWVPVDRWTEFLEPEPTTRIEGVLRSMDGAADLAPLEVKGHPIWPQTNETFLGVFRRGVGIPWLSIAAAEGITAPAVVLGPQLESLDTRDLQRLPASGYTTYLKVEHHEHYAWQWFGFAAIAAALRGWWWWRSRRQPRPSPGGTPGS